MCWILCLKYNLTVITHGRDDILDLEWRKIGLCLDYTKKSLLVPASRFAFVVSFHSPNLGLARECFLWLSDPSMVEVNETAQVGYFFFLAQKNLQLKGYFIWFI